MAAVRQNGTALCHVKNQTPEICLAAVEQNRAAFEMIRNRILKEETKCLLKKLFMNTNHVACGVKTAAGDMSRAVESHIQRE